MLTCLPDSSHIVPSTAWGMTTISKMGPTIVVDLLKLRVLRGNPIVGLAPPRANRARDKSTKRMASTWRYPGPHQLDPTSLSFVSKS
jgi:hypothetical protein